MPHKHIFCRLLSVIESAEDFCLGPDQSHPGNVNIQHFILSKVLNFYQTILIETKIKINLRLHYFNFQVGDNEQNRLKKYKNNE